MRFVFLFILTFFFSCDHAKKEEPSFVERSMYYWKSVFKLSKSEMQALDNLEIKTLYIKYFDVGWDDASNSALPIAQIKIPDSSFLQKTLINIVPTIFITNETIFKLKNSQTEDLANKILLLVNNINKNNGLNKYEEIQIDCDWTATTKEKYFDILTCLQKIEKAKLFSATVRLHQIKYSNKTGVPPVKKGMLMCYNMGNLNDPDTKNSIIELNEMQRYISDLQNYPIPLDIALPIFDWKVIFRNDKFKGLVKDVSYSSIIPAIFNRNGNIYKAIKDTILNGYEIKKNDIWRNEQSEYTEILKAAKAINLKLNGKNRRVALYHLDNLTLKKYKTYEMENIYNSFR